MLSSRGRLQLLLGWALVLGQLLVGSEEVSPPAFSSDEQVGPPGEDSCCQRLNPEIEYKERAERFRRGIKRRAATEPNPVDFDWKNMAVEALNDQRYGNSEHFTHLEESFMKVRKAFGAHVSFKLLLKKTNCTMEQMEGHHGHLTNSVLEHRGCKPLDEEGEAEPKYCKFQVALDARTGRQKVIDHFCHFPYNSEEYLRS